MKFFEIFLSVMGIIAIIAAAAFILIFLVDLFVSISDKSEGIFFKKWKKIKDEEVKNTDAVAGNAVAEEAGTRVPYYAEEVNVAEEKPAEIDYEAAAKEQAELEKLNAIELEDETANDQKDEAEVETIETMPVVEEPKDDEIEMVEDSVKEDKIAKILEQYEDVIALQEEKDDAQDALDDFKNEEDGLNAIKDEQENEILANEDENDELDKLIKDLSGNEEQAEFKEILEDVKEEKDELEEGLAKTNAELEEVINQKEEAQKLIEEKDKEIEKLKEELAKAKEEKASAKPVVVVGGATIEELELRLEVLNERKKANAKELKKVRREYTPLNTIRKTLESDKKKLRRKEAILFKQNVLLYGVNNYVDLDDEKAKKLAEEQDLLKGLSMSVRHCEEVLENNKDRLPVLEQAYKILTKNKETIDHDIEEVEMAIAQLKAQKNN